MDGLENVLTGLGISGRDPRQGGRYRWRRKNWSELEAFHDSSDIAQIVCDKIPAYATKKWLTHVVKGDADIIPNLIKEDERLCAREKFRKAMSWARIYGGAMILMVVDDGKELEEPLDLGSIRKIENLVVLHRWEVYRQIIGSELSDPNFGLPEFYQVTGRTIAGVPQVHHSRFIRFDGIPLSEEGFRRNDYWGDSYLTTLFDIARDYDAAYSGVMLALKDFGVNVLRLKDLANIVGSDNEDKLKARLKLMQLSKSILSSVVIDANEEEYTLLERSFTNIGQVLERIDKRLQMVTGLPHTMLFGEGSTGTLGAGGESEQNTLADLIATAQEDSLRRQFKIYAEVVQAQREGPTSGKILTDYSFKFNPLNEPTEMQLADFRLKVAETDQKYSDMGVLSPSEIANSRFGGEGYSAETQIDKEARSLQEDLDKEKVKEKIENPLGAKNNDPDPKKGAETGSPPRHRKGISSGPQPPVKKN